MIRTLAAMSLLAAVASGCDPDPGGFVRGPELALQACETPSEPRTFAPFERDLVFLATERDETAMTLMFAADQRVAPPPDVLVLSTTDVHALREAASTGAEVALTSGETAPLMVSLALQKTCPQATQSLVGTGTATFTAFGWNDGERVAGSMTFDLLDARTGAVVATGLTAGFDFEVEIGLPNTAFIDGEQQGF